MTRNFFRIVTVVFFVFTALGIGALVLFPGNFLRQKKDRTPRQTRIILPRARETDFSGGGGDAERQTYEDSLSTKAALSDGEVLTAVLTENLDEDPTEEQLIAYRNLLEIESPIYISYIDYDEKTRGYKRIWSAPTAATRPGTISLYTQDLIGDRSVCALVTGMNGLGEHTLTVFRKMPSPGAEGVFSASSGASENRRTGPDQAEDREPFSKIAELRIDGSILVQETERPQAYQLGIAKGPGFTLAAYGRDYESSNILDQVEISYTYNGTNGLYEQNKITRIPGSQIEQRRLKELLSGKPGPFEEFINGLWYYVSPQGTLDSRQYIYFDPQNREIIFYGDEIQQVFTWQNSSATRYGLYISSHNISVTTLRRSLDIELESLDSIRVKVFDDVRLKIGVNAPWDGSYRKAGTPGNYSAQGNSKMPAHVDAVYDGSIGKLGFFPDGTYELSSGGTVLTGKYVFFSLDNRELLEFRPDNKGQGETYLVEGTKPTGEAGANEETPWETFTLKRIRIGARGIQELHEGAVFFSRAGEYGS
jgi:hypothetical protein